MKRLLLALALICASQAAVSVERWHTALLGRIYPQGDGSFVLTFQTDSPPCTNANAPKYHYVIAGLYGMTDEGAKKVYAAAMLAMALGKPLTIAYDDSTANCAV